jgi:endo-beta-N-acetylglucosaminidase D
MMQNYKKQQDNLKALNNFFAEMGRDVAKRNKFLNRVWSNKAKMPSLYPEKS